MDILGTLATGLQAGLSGPVKDYNSFMGVINGALTNPLGSIGGIADLAGFANPYASQNTLEHLQRRGEPVLSFEWLAVVLDPNPSSSLPWYYIDTITCPGMSIAQQSNYFNGLTKHYAGNVQIDQLELGLFTDKAAVTFNYAAQWFNGTYRTDGFFNLPSRYKRDVILYVLDEKRKTIIDIRFIGCWPTNYAPYQLDSNNNVVETRLTLSVDQVIFNTETSLSRAVDRFKNQLPGIVTDIGAGIIGYPPAV